MTMRNQPRHFLAHFRGLTAGIGLLVLAGCPPDRGAGGGGGDLSGTYVAKSNEGTMTLEFKKDHKVHVTMQEAGGQPDGSEADYMVEGNKITIQVPGGFPIHLVREGNELSSSVMGQILHFKKK